MAILTMRTIIFILLLYLPIAHKAFAANGENGQQLALGLRNGVIRISSPETGFGLVIGEHGNDLYILTAYHVISEDDKLYKTVIISFNHEPSKKVATTPYALDKQASDRDIGILKAPKPKGFFWRKDTMAMAKDHDVGMKVWYIGQSNKWKIPPDSGTIKNEDIKAGEKVYLNMPVRAGSSGAPLISDYGIFGMLLAERPSSRGSKGIAIDTILSACQRNRVPWLIEPGPFSTPSMFRAKREYDFEFTKEALRKFEEEARKGNLTAMVYAAMIYMEEGQENSQQAIRWARHAANKGNGAGMMLLGLMHGIRYGGLKRDYTKGFYWIRKSAEECFPEAVFHLGMVYQNGIYGQSPDVDKAIMYYRKACRLGYISASRRLRELGQAPCD